MKWFFTANQESLQDPNFFRLVEASIRSARTNTRLQPFIGYHGGPCPEIKKIQNMGVEVLEVRPAIADALSDYADRNKLSEVHRRTRMGAFLRIDLPRYILKTGIDDKYILYTDCDVIFLRDIDIRSKPKFFCANGAWHRRFRRIPIYYRHFNSGVLYMNVRSMAEEADHICNFIVANGGNKRRPPGRYMSKNLFMSDQVALNLYFMNRYDQLQDDYNWHPTRGPSEKARIVHFNGLKWTQWRDFERGAMSQHHLKKYIHLKRFASEYSHFTALAESFVS